MEAATLRRALLVVAGVLAALLALVLVRALSLPSRQVDASPAPPLAVDAEAVASRLAEAIRFRTVSYQDRERLEPAEFQRLHDFLARAYPRTAARLRRERIAELSLLYTWPGRDPALRPVLLAAHQDVVPIDPAGEWTHPPFAGRIADGFVWGRGAMDDKGALVCILEAVETLLAQGYEPERGVMLAFGHDEEVSGYDGAARIAERLAERGVVPELVLDEGGAITRGLVPGVDAPVALVGIAEKGSVSIQLGLEAAGGHSSVPPPHTAIGILAAALQRLEANPMPGAIDGTTAVFFDHLAPELPFPLRAALANRWLLGGVITRVLVRDPRMAALLRTTTAVTIFEAGVKENVLPSRARAVVNFRIRPGDTIDDVVEHVRRTIDDERIELQVGVRSKPRNPIPASSIDSESFALLVRTLREVFPGVKVVPNLVLGGTDARHYRPLTENVYRLAPFVFGREALVRLHGTDERTPVDGLPDAVRFYVRLLRNTTSEPARRTTARLAGTPARPAEDRPRSEPKASEAGF